MKKNFDLKFWRVPLIFLLLFMAVGCGTTRQQRGAEYFECFTNSPTPVLDSIANFYQLSIPSVEEWEGAFYLSSDSTATIIRHYVAERERMTYIFSVTSEIIDTTARDTVIVRFRKEK